MLHDLIRTKSKEAGCECVDADIVEPFPATINDRRRTKALFEELCYDIKYANSKYGGTVSME